MNESVVCKCGADLRAVPFVELQLHDKCERGIRMRLEDCYDATYTTYRWGRQSITRPALAILFALCAEIESRYIERNRFNGNGKGDTR